MSDQPTANIEDTDAWHDANSYYGDEMKPIMATRTLPWAKDIATALELARSYLRDKALAPRVIEIAFEGLAEAEALADRVEAAENERDKLRANCCDAWTPVVDAISEKLQAAEARVAELEKIAGQERAARKALSIELQNANEDYEKLSKEKT